jgi:hypothetical protein
MTFIRKRVCRRGEISAPENLGQYEDLMRRDIAREGRLGKSYGWVSEDPMKH